MIYGYLFQLFFTFYIAARADTINHAQSSPSYQTQQADGQRGVLARPLRRIPPSLRRICGVLVDSLHVLIDYLWLHQDGLFTLRIGFILVVNPP